MQRSDLSSYERNLTGEGGSVAGLLVWRILGSSTDLTLTASVLSSEKMIERRAAWSLLVLCAGLLLLVAGGLIYLFTSNILACLLSQTLLLSPQAAHYEMWRVSPVPVTLSIYFFNWTNPHELKQPGAKPKLVEMGPYAFREYHEKVDIVWDDDNNTVSYRQVRWWQFDPDQSRGSLDDLVTTVNVVPACGLFFGGFLWLNGKTYQKNGLHQQLRIWRDPQVWSYYSGGLGVEPPTRKTAAYISRDWGIFMQAPMSMTFSATGQKAHVIHKVRELLFEGYDDALLKMGSKFQFISDMKIPYDKFGWFYMRNGTASWDGHYNMATGAGDIYQIGQLKKWNYSNRTRFYSGDCGRIHGSAGELWPPLRARDDKIDMSIALDYCDDVEVSGARGYRYKASASILDNGTLDASTACFCGGRCSPVGVLNVSSCRFGSPAFVSYPHFYLGDQYYLQQVEGLSPDKDRHEFYVTLEPTSGIPLDVAARVQVNILLEDRPNVGLYEGIPTLYMPVIWFEARGTVTPDQVSSLAPLAALPTFVLACTLTLLTLGALLVAGVAVYCWLHPETSAHFLERRCQKRSATKLDHSLSPLVKDNKSESIILKVK
uniref:Protein peste n=1 Tax=Timema genevievae TaxID=629358 RepID=A0A7R9K7K2_TIMGE|nr:unnamed protein product [Timema genevievae]